MLKDKIIVVTKNKVLHINKYEIRNAANLLLQSANGG